MKTKKRRSVGNTEQAQQAPIIIKSGGSGIVMPVVGVVALFGTYFFIVKPAIAQHALNKGESDTSPEGQVANQFKAVFGPKDSANWVVSDSDYRAAALLLTNENKELVYKKYRALTDRNLSDDIAKHIGADVHAKAAKIQQYNSKPGKLFSITPEGRIKFEVAPKDKVRIAVGQTTPVIAYQAYEGIILKEINDPKLIERLRKDPKTILFTLTIPIKPSGALYTVVATKEVPYATFQKAAGWSQYLRPYVKVSKTFAMVQIVLGINPKTKKAVLAWIDARDMVTFSKKPLKGLGVASLLI